MNRLKFFTIALALIAGGSALASAEEHHRDRNGWYYQDRDHDRDDGRYRYGYYGRYNDHDRDDRYVYRNNGWYNGWHRDRYDDWRYRNRSDRWRYDHDRD